MAKKSKRFKRNENGIAISTMMAPSIVILGILHALIILFIIGINNNSANLSSLVARSAANTADATSLLAGSSLLSETSTNYVLRPFNDNSQPNTGPLIAFTTELEVDRRGKDVLAKLKANGASQEALNLIQSAANSADYMLNNQLNAIALTTAVYPLPDIPQLKSLKLPPLNEEDSVLSNEQKLEKATYLLLSDKYSQEKSNVSTGVNQCVGVLQADSGRETAIVNSRVNWFRMGLWSAVSGALIILVAIFVILYLGLHKPLVDATRYIGSDKPLEENKGFREMRALSSAYNRIMKRRDFLDGQLRAAAEKDALTGLGNRYSFDKIMDRVFANRDDHRTITYFIFDINYLKETNDNEGHEAGDRLIIKASDIIRECFRDSDGNNCFRLGGDEFASVVIGENEEMIQNRQAVFLEQQKENGISISWGYASAPDIANAILKILMRDADLEMYKCKAKMHRQSKEN